MQPTVEGLGPETILLAEDEEADVFRLRRALDQLQLHYGLQVMENGEQVIDYLSGRGAFADRQRYPFPSMLLLDMKLPLKSGAEVLEWLRENSLAQPLFVVTLTGASQRGVPSQTFEQRGDAWTFNFYFLKPIDRESLNMILTLFEHWKKCRVPDPPSGNGSPASGTA